MRKESGNSERLARRVVKLKGAYVNLREIVDIMQSAPEKSGNDLVFASELLEKVVLETNRYLEDLNLLLGKRQGLLRASSTRSAARVAARYLAQR